MKESKDYQPNLSRGILLLGQPGMGKTTTALTIAKPVPYIVDCDNNLAGATSVLGANIPFKYDIPDLEKLPEFRFQYLCQCIEAASKSTEIGTLITDSLTKCVDYVVDEILRQQARKVMQLQDWGVFLNVMKRTITRLRSTQKLFIATAHIRPEKDEVAGFLKYFPALPGQLQNVIGALFSDVWLCDVEERDGKYNYIVRTKATTFYALKNSFGPEMTPVMTAEAIRPLLNQ